MEKYGIYDYNGGGRGSGRITIGHVIGGAIAKKLLKTQGIEIVSHVVQIGDIKAKNIDYENLKESIEKNNVKCGDEEAAKLMEELILSKKQEGDSVGGIVETIATGVPAGLGEPVFGKLDGDLAQILMSINAVKGVEIGLGFESAKSSASEINDEFYYDEDNNVKTKTNNSGGILGGMSNGMPIVSRIAVKPTPSISKIENTIDLEKGENTTIEISGRHDPCICPRVTAVAESATAIILADHMIRGGFIHPTNLNKSI
jgi:chorismate synthase